MKRCAVLRETSVFVDNSRDILLASKPSGSCMPFNTNFCAPHLLRANTVVERSTLLCGVSRAVVILSAVTLMYSPASFGQDKLSKFLLIKLSREQSNVLCKSEVFTQCMNFTESSCLALSEKAVEQCLDPLPDTINLQELQNDTLESCPRQVYEEAGYTDLKAQDCLQKAMK